MRASLSGLLNQTLLRMCRLRVQTTYLWRHRRLANIDDPQLLTEHVQRRKLLSRDPRLPDLADKVLVKTHVSERIGERWVVPTLWRGICMPPIAAWPVPFVVKSRHGCGHVCIVRDDADYRIARHRSRRWMSSRYGGWLDEWLYGEIEPGLLVEPFLGIGPALPLDYKLFVFGGRVRYVQVHLNRATNHRWVVFDLNWRRVSPAVYGVDPVRPRSLPQMIAAAEELGRDFDFVRADFYEIGGRPLFGELTFYPGSGREPLEPPSLNRAMGALWSAARAGDHNRSPVSSIEVAAAASGRHLPARARAAAP